MKEYLSFAIFWLGTMALIGLALWITGLFRKKGDDEKVDPEKYAEQFENELAEKTPEKPIKKFFRNPYVLSDDEIQETKDSTDRQQ